MNHETSCELLRPRMLYEALADAIRERIFRHELAPGDALDEFLLAKNYVVSRTPIREALKVLATEGIVELRARRGSFVARLAWADVVQLFGVLELLEAFAVREAARRRTTLEIGGSFQHSLAAASSNVFLPELLERLVSKLRLAFGPLFDSPQMQPAAELRAELAKIIASGEGVDHALRQLAAYSESRRGIAQELYARASRLIAERQENRQPGEQSDPGEGSEIFTAALI